VTSGFGYRIGKFDIDGAFQLILYEDRVIDNNVDDHETLSSSSIDGTYENIAVGVSLSSCYRF